MHTQLKRLHLSPQFCGYKNISESFRQLQSNCTSGVHGRSVGVSYWAHLFLKKKSTEAPPWNISRSRQATLLIQLLYCFLFVTCHVHSVVQPTALSATLRSKNGLQSYRSQSSTKEQLPLGSKKKKTASALQSGGM